jgi:cell cycle sensor histidine kinase DivJ
VPALRLNPALKPNRERARVTRRPSDKTGATGAALAVDALWLGVCGVGAALEAIASGGVSLAQAVFLACAVTPVILERVAFRNTPGRGATTLTAIAWLIGAVALIETSDAAGGLFAVWLAIPAASAAVRGRAGRAVIESLALSALAAVALVAVGLVGAEGAGWSYGALPIVSAFGVAALVCIAATRAARAYRLAASRAGIEGRRLAAVMEASPDVFLRIDNAGRVRAADGGGEGKLVEDAAVYVGAAAAGLFAPSEAARFNQAMIRVRRTGEPERLVLASDEGLIEARMARMADRDVMLIMRPASAEVEALPAAERERDAAEAAARARSRFFASMSHELRTPLNAVLGFSDAMRLKTFGPMPAKYAEYAEDIHTSAKHLLDLVGDLLDVSKIEAGRYELELSRFDAREALHAAARMMRPAAEAGKILFEIDAGDEPIEVEADLRALKQMLLNLTSNAVKFTAAGGLVKVSSRAEGLALIVEVSDTGPGLAPDEILRIARPFEQTREGLRHPSRSSGLGLALVRSLCELHAGRLEIESEPGRGATFRLRLPVLAGTNEPEKSLDARGRLQRIKDAGFGGSGGGAVEKS